ncbi:hypothetical protein FCY04_24200 [Escherichia coli]|nr:hypothetical protein [Escherichia coli]
MSIKNDGHYFCRAGGNRPDGLNEPVTFIHTIWHQHSLRHARKSTQPLARPCRGWVNPDVLYTSHRRLYVHPQTLPFY